ncbi:MAG: DUF4402 domain-containing protein [Holophaga sp.]|nr:DUF4402 domain-containing protein [Holophaga sp.]
MLKKIIALGLVATPGALMAIDVEATATIVTATRVREVDPMDFGSIIPVPAAPPGTAPQGGDPVARLRATGTRDLNGSGLRGGTTPGSRAGTAAVFEFTGMAGNTFTVRPIPAFNLSLQGNRNVTMQVTVDHLRAAGDNVDVALGMALANPTGVRRFTLASTLTVPRGQTPGIYSGTYSVTVDQN